jgi:hypothetical protein
MIKRLKLVHLGQKEEPAYEDINERTRGVNRTECHDHPCFQATFTESTTLICCRTLGQDVQAP